MKAILPAAGYATRMYPLTENLSKCLLKIKKRSIIDYALLKLEKIKSIDKVIIVSNNKYYKDFLKYKKNAKFNFEITIINDKSNSNEARLGSVKDISLALKESKIEEDFIVLNPDNLFTFDLRKIHEEFLKKQKSIISLFDVKSLEQARKMGNPVTDSNGKIIEFKEKDPDVSSTICTIGIYFFKKEIIDRISEYLESGKPADRFGDFISWLYKKEDIYGYLFSENESWFDIGSIESYEKAKNIKDIERFM